MPAETPVEAIVQFTGEKELTLNDLLFQATHYRGFRLATSYCILEVGNPHSEAVNEFMNHGTFSLKYGREGRFTPTMTFEIFAVRNSVAFSNVGVQVVGVESGFLRLAEQVKMRSFQNQAISDVLHTLAGEAQLKTTKIKATQGKGNFLQTNVSALQLITKYLLPISIDSVGTVPYLFTVDNGVLWYQPPTLTKKPQQSFILDPSIDTLTKNFHVQNQGSLSDFAYGNTLKGFAYDWTEKGTITHDEELDSVSSQKKLSKHTYESDFTRQVTLPYDQQWMLTADLKNRLAKAQFVVQSDVVMDGSPDYMFDEVLKFSLPEKGIQKLKEYSIPYYVFSLCNVLQIRKFHTHLTLKANAFLKNQKPGEE